MLGDFSSSQSWWAHLYSYFILKQGHKERCWYMVPTPFLWRALWFSSEPWAMKQVWRQVEQKWYKIQCEADGTAATTSIIWWWKQKQRPTLLPPLPPQVAAHVVKKLLPASPVLSVVVPSKPCCDRFIRHKDKITCLPAYLDAALNIASDVSSTLSYLILWNYSYWCLRTRIRWFWLSIPLLAPSTPAKYVAVHLHTWASIHLRMYLMSTQKPVHWTLQGLCMYGRHA